MVSAEVVWFGELEVFGIVGLEQGGFSLYLPVPDCLEDIRADGVVADEADSSAVSDESRGPRGGGYQALGCEGVGGPVVPHRFP